MIVERVAGGAQLVVHVERHDHAQVHVDELGGEVEVAFQVGTVDDVDDDVGRLVDEVAADVKLLGAVGRKRVGAGQIHDAHAIFAVSEVAVLGVDRHSAVIAHMLVGARGDVEERGLAAVGVAHERHVDGASFFAGHVGHTAFEHGFGLGIVSGVGRKPRQTGIFGEGCAGLGLALADDFDQAGLFASQRDFVAHYLILYGVAQGGIQDDADGLTLYKAHFDDALAETAVSAHLDDDAALACTQFRKLHMC